MQLDVDLKALGNPKAKLMLALTLCDTEILFKRKPKKVSFLWLTHDKELIFVNRTVILRSCPHLLT